MKPRTVIAFWAALLALWAALQLLFSPAPVTVLLLGGAAALTFAFALVSGRVRPRRPAPDLSFATPLLAVGLATLLSGSELGTWCLALGALITACGVAALVEERR